MNVLETGETRAMIASRLVLTSTPLSVMMRMSVKELPQQQRPPQLQPQPQQQQQRPQRPPPPPQPQQQPRQQPPQPPQLQQPRQPLQLQPLPQLLQQPQPSPPQQPHHSSTARTTTGFTDGTVANGCALLTREWRQLSVVHLT